MYTTLTFNPIIKYILVFIITYMFLNSINIRNEQIIPILLFTILIIVVFDIFMFSEFIQLLQQNQITQEQI